MVILCGSLPLEYSLKLSSKGSSKRQAESRAGEGAGYKRSLVRRKGGILPGTTSPIFGPAPYGAVRRSMRRRTAP